ncbi:MAG: L,D-transpeptidase, partial [Thermoanaerobaculia bacterium]
SQYLFQKSIDLSIKKIRFYKEKQRLEKENYLKEFEEISDLNSKIKETLNRIPLGSDIYVNFLKSYTYLKESENLYKIGKLEKAKTKLASAQFLNEKLFSQIKDSLKSFYSPEKIREWKNLYNEALNLSSSSSVIVVIKDERVLKVLRNGRVFKLYSVEFGKNPLSKKTKSGDLATPEGRYKITEKKGFGRTKYYLALLLNYPNEEDKRRFEEAKRKGLIPKNSKIGGLIEIHGDGGLGIDWTQGCVALSNEDMKDLYNLSFVGMPVYIIGSVGNNDVLSNLEEEKIWKNSKNS